MTELQLREATPDDAPMCGRIMVDAFEALATRHRFPIEAGTPEFADFHITAMLATDGIDGLAAERDGRIVGSALQDERGKIVGVGPVAVDPVAAGAGAGRALMKALLRRSDERDVAGVRLVQMAYNCQSFSLYAKLGFSVRELLSVFQGTPRESTITGAVVGPATPDDIAARPDLPAGARPRPPRRAAAPGRSSPPAWSSVAAGSPATRRVSATPGPRSARPTTRSSHCWPVPTNHRPRVPRTLPQYPASALLTSAAAGDPVRASTTATGPAGPHRRSLRSENIDLLAWCPGTPTGVNDRYKVVSVTPRVLDQGAVRDGGRSAPHHKIALADVARLNLHWLVLHAADPTLVTVALIGREGSLLEQ